MPYNYSALSICCFQAWELDLARFQATLEDKKQALVDVIRRHEDLEEEVRKLSGHDLTSNMEDLKVG